MSRPDPDPTHPGGVFGHLAAVADVAIRPATTSVSGNRHAMRNGGAANLGKCSNLGGSISRARICARGHLRGGPGITIRRERYRYRSRPCGMARTKITARKSTGFGFGQAPKDGGLCVSFDKVPYWQRCGMHAAGSDHDGWGW